MTRSGGSGAGAVRRVRVRRRGEQWTIEGETRVEEMTLPPSNELPPGRGRPLAGFWYEARDGRGRTLFRRVTRNPAEQAVEVPAADGGLQRVEMARPEVVFDVLIPDLAAAAELCFFESDPRAGDAMATLARSLTPVARLPLRPRPAPRPRPRPGAGGRPGAGSRDGRGSGRGSGPGTAGR
jgi:hypothetical protein